MSTTIDDQGGSDMGVLTIRAAGSFPSQEKTFGAMDHGHAHAVSQAIRFLAEEVLPEAIERDCRLLEQGVKPSKGFDRPPSA